MNIENPLGEFAGTGGIHPGVKRGSRVYPLVNTCKPSSVKRRADRALVGLRRHYEKHPNDNVTAVRISRLEVILKS